MTEQQGRHETVQDRPNETRPAGRAARIEACLRVALAPEAIAVEDDSARHVGHAGHRPEGETHYNVRVVAAAFRGLGRVARSRVVHAALAAEFAGGMHALSLRLLTPEEAAAER